MTKIYLFSCVNDDVYGRSNVKFTLASCNTLMLVLLLKNLTVLVFQPIYLVFSFWSFLVNFTADLILLEFARFPPSLPSLFHLPPPPKWQAHSMPPQEYNVA